MVLEKLFGIEINYNVRVNFSSLVKVLDELAGITVYNHNTFTSLHGNYYWKWSYVKKTDTDFRESADTANSTKDFLRFLP